jgi:hypothetical protein
MRRSTTSFQLSKSQNNDYISFVILKGFLEYCFLKNMVLYYEIGHAFGEIPLQYNATIDQLSNTNLNYNAAKDYILLSFGLAYRIRTN